MLVALNGSDKNWTLVLENTEHTIGVPLECLTIHKVIL
jgi:hypothetical protein